MQTPQHPDRQPRKLGWAPRCVRGGFSLLEVMITTLILSLALVITADCLGNGSKASLALDVGADLQERADFFTSLIALHVRGTSYASTTSTGNGGVIITSPGTSMVGSTSYGAPVSTLTFTASTGFGMTGATAKTNAGSQVSLTVTNVNGVTNIGTLYSTDLGWGRLTGVTPGILCNDVSSDWWGPDISKLGPYPSGLVYSPPAPLYPHNGLGFFVIRALDRTGNPSLLIIGLSLQNTLPDGEIITRASVREIHLSQSP